MARDAAVPSPAGSKRALRCVVADHHKLLVEAIEAALVSARHEVVGTAFSGRDALRVIQRVEADVAILDLGLRDIGPAEIARAVPGTRVVIFTGGMEQPDVDEALAAGVLGLVSKRRPLKALVRAVERVAQGTESVDAAVFEQIPRKGPLVSLSPREREVLALVALGLGYGEIAGRLGIAVPTVQRHVRNAMRRLNATTRTHGVAKAIRLGLID